MLRASDHWSLTTGACKIMRFAKFDKKKTKERIGNK